MARRETKVSEERLQAVIDNWNRSEIGDLAQMLGVDENTINSWAARLRKSMKKHGMSAEQIKKLLPTKRKVPANVFDIVVKRLQSPEQAPKKRGRKPKETH